MEIYLIRHTTPDIEKGICYGQSNIGVKDSFNNEVKAILKQHSYLEDLNATIYCSPLQRCKKLVENLFNAPILFDDRLKELYFGDWELQKWDSIDQNELSIWMKDFVNINTTNGESYIDLQTRVLDFFKEINRSDKKTKVIVTHAGVIRTLLAHFQNVPLEDSFQFKVEYGQVFKLNTSTLKNEY